MRVLIATDFQEHSLAALQHVAAQRWPKSDEFELLNVVAPINVSADITTGYVQSAVDYHVDLLNKHHALLERDLEWFKALLPNNKIRGAVVTGSPVATIIEEAEKWDADLIVLGSHDYKGLAQIFIGSVAEGVVKKAPCSVSVVRSRTKPVAQSASDASRVLCDK